MVPRYVEGLTSNVQKCEGRTIDPSQTVSNTANNGSYRKGSGRS